MEKVPVNLGGEDPFPHPAPKTSAPASKFCCRRLALDTDGEFGAKMELSDIECRLLCGREE